VIEPAIESHSKRLALPVSYILPIRTETLEGLGELTDYLQRLSRLAEVIVVDGSPTDVFSEHAILWPAICHVRPSPQFKCANGKVAGVLTGLVLASHDRVVIADDDVRYDEGSLRQTVQLLDNADVVRPQNYFVPRPWHATWDSARSLINRALDGDWPGTLAVRRSLLNATSGYDGNAMFENLELVRTVLASGGTQAVARDVFVRRLPPTSRQFWSQRVRQAYDEFARPWRLVLQLCLAPLVLYALTQRRRWLLYTGVGSVALAELGRRRECGTSVFGVMSSVMAPIWLLERAVCVWLAVFSRLRYGGVRYRGGIIRSAATPQSVLNKRFRK
jgi:glycosyltransferase involved in cell wall biosynthesis